jgi:hypothetical protein
MLINAEINRMDRMKKKCGRRNAAMRNKRDAACYSSFILAAFSIAFILTILSILLISFRELSVPCSA